jgi:hypothetical protein
MVTSTGAKWFSIRLSQDLMDKVFDPQDESCYVEFRALGGQNYQYKLKELLRGISKFIETMRKSVDPKTDANLYNTIQYYRKKYNRKSQVEELKICSI